MGCVPTKDAKKQQTSQTVIIRRSKVEKTTGVRRRHHRSMTEIIRLEMEVNGQKVDFPIFDFKQHLDVPSSSRSRCAGTDERQRPPGKQKQIVTHKRSPSFEKELNQKIQELKRAQAMFKSRDYQKKTSLSARRVQSSIN